ncbi:OmpA family protein [Muricoccus radiodurans]|uniref:OmpA family protein n=1 Tax=Muricoccus radiodurans TaxID=2231721 RepID=UPI003CECCED9
MARRFLKHALLASALALPGAALAQPISGLYIAGAGGANWLMDSDATSSSAAVRANFGNGSIEFETGWVALGSLGWGFGNGLRLEVEGSYRRNSVDGASGFGGLVRPLRTTGHVSNWAVMANVLYDFVIPGSPVMPYLGGGVGYAQTNYQGVRVQGFNGPRLDLVGSEGNFAYQGIAGLAFNIAAVPGLAVTAEYRFFGTLDPSIRSNYVPAAGVVARTNTEVENFNHSVLVGLRYAFNQPRPAVVATPVVAAQPTVARTYLVFFDWDRADLTDRARQIIAEAANASRSTQTTRIEVAGHADRSGTPQYNQRLSQRRAEVVAAELARNGVSRSAISISAFGESRPLVPTADGVREPQNRRVEIVLR